MSHEEVLKRIRDLKALADDLDTLCRRAKVMHDALKDDIIVMRASHRSTAADTPLRRPRRSKHR